MGMLHYGQSDDGIEIPDRTLAHLQIVMVAKLRRHESFLFTVNIDDGSQITRSLWLNEAVNMSFTYSTQEHYSINRQWLEELSISANSAAGLHLVQEPEERAVPKVRPESTLAAR